MDVKYTYNVSYFVHKSPTEKAIHTSFYGS